MERQRGACGMAIEGSLAPAATMQNAYGQEAPVYCDSPNGVAWAVQESGHRAPPVAVPDGLTLNQRRITFSDGVSASM